MTGPAERGGDGGGGRASLGRRLMWFALLWLAGVGAVGAVALLIRLWLGAG